LRRGQIKSRKTLKLLVAATSPLTIQVLLRGQLSYMSDKGLEVHVLCAKDLDRTFVAAEKISGFWPVPLRRTPSPFYDIVALVRIFTVIRRIRPDIVNAGTPKAAFLVLLAARLACVPARVYTLRGLRLETSSGFSRTFLKWIELITASCAQRVIAVSKSLADLYVAQGLASGTKIAVLGKGSSNGVDCVRFARIDPLAPALMRLRTQLHIPNDSFVIGFVGRLTKDKGISDLLEAFQLIQKDTSTIRLLLVGQQEQADAISPSDSYFIKHTEAVVASGYVDDVVPYYNLMNVLVLPSQREGFPNAVLEAAACGIPTIAYRVTGIRDAIQDGLTGRLIEPGDITDLVAALSHYQGNPSICKQHGRNARQHAIANFRPESIWSGLYDQYCELISS